MTPEAGPPKGHKYRDCTENTRRPLNHLPPLSIDSLSKEAHLNTAKHESYANAVLAATVLSLADDGMITGWSVPLAEFVIIATSVVGIV